MPNMAVKPNWRHRWCLFYNIAARSVHLFFSSLNHYCLSPAFVLVATVGAGDPPKLIQNNGAVKKNIIHTNPNFHMQIRLSQQSLSPLHHFLHSNAFSLLYKIPPYSPTPWLGSFCRNYRRNFRTFPASKEDMHDGDCVLYVLLPRICGDNKKNGRAGRFFSPLGLYNESPARSAFNRRQSVYLKALSDG